METRNDLELTILMPCLNEAGTLETCIKQAQSYLARSGVAGEVLIADNGSTDGSQDIALRLVARVVPVAQRGYGAALHGGIHAARGRRIIMGDADDSYDFLHLEPFMEMLQAGKQLVMGNRFRGGIAPGAMPFLHKYLGNPALSFLGRLFYSIPVGDFHCGLRGFHADSVRSLDLRTTGMEFASEMVVKSALNGLTIAEVPTKLKKDGRNRKPHLRTWRDGWRHLCFLLTLAPKWMFTYPGLFLTVLGALPACLLLGGPLHLGGVELDIKTFIFSALSLLIGLHALTTGVIVKQYAARTGILPSAGRTGLLERFLSRDRLALVSGIFFTIGLGMAFYCVASWAGTGFGALENTVFERMAVLSFTFMAAAVQFFHAAFLYEILSAPITPQR
jgi:hypothetical protein